jgi:membrane dipeptidase
MTSAGMTAQVFGLVTLPHLQRGLMQEALKQISCVEEAVARSSGRLALVTSAQEVLNAKVCGQKVVLLSLEGIQAVDQPRDRLGYADPIAALRVLCARKVRSVGLVHFSRNSAATPGLGKGANAHAGLTPLGHQMVDALEDWGVLIDLAHLSKAGFLDVCARARNPPIVSHTGLQHFYPLGRNIDDEQIRAVAKAGGVIGIMYSRQFLGSAELKRVVEEFVHLHNVGGEDVLALGSDFDGFVIPPRGLSDVRGLPVLTAALWDALGERATRKLLGENVLRVLEAVPVRV